MTAFSFGRRRIGPDEPVVVIAEIGINHEGDSGACCRMIETAAKAGADAIKLQTVDPDENYAPDHPSHALYQRARLGREDTAKAFALAAKLGMEAFTTTGLSDLEWVEPLQPVAYKISSGLLTHLPLIRRIAGLGRPLLISAGMSEAQEIDEAVSTARTNGCTELALLQCTPLYPAPIETVSLRTIGWLASRYDAPAGLSDHSLGGEIAALAVAAGACVIEKHFSFDPGRAGFDHAISLDPSGLAAMIAGIRRAQLARGHPDKHLTDAERDVARRMLRTLVARRDIAEGDVITESDIAIMRSIDGMGALLPRDLDRVVGRRARRKVACWTSIPADIIDDRPADGARGHARS